MPRFSIQNVQIDTEAREVSADGDIQPLEPRAFDALVFLIENRGRTVPKEDLLDQVWKGRIVTDSVLTQAIAKCRKVLRDDSAELIKTVHRVGYRFDGSVVELDSKVEAQTGIDVLLAVGAADARQISLAEADPVDDCVVVRCGSVGDALQKALALQSSAPRDGIGIHAAASGQHDEIFDPPLVAAELSRAGIPGQILLSTVAFELGRADAALGNVKGLTWLAHGTYRLAELNTVVSLFEAGVPGHAPLKPPPDREGSQRALADEIILGWRAGPGQSVPNRSNWILERCLGEGGFGEAWLAEHMKTREQRVFKFCYRADRLRSLQREVTVFRLLLETLGDRPDIARILDWNFDEAPYSVESEYTADGDLVQWMEAQGGAALVDRQVRLTLVAQTARALAAAHAVGVLHKDVKPANILVRSPAGDTPQAILCDFGIGLITDSSALAEHDITQLDATDSVAGSVSTLRSGTRRYMAPEVLEGKNPTIQADIYALGVVLYQLAVGDLDRVLAPGWEREIDDEILREDISRMVDRDPARRFGDANLVAEHLETLDERRERRWQQAAAEAKLEKERRRRRILIPAIAVVTAFAVGMGFLTYRVNQEAGRANRQALLALNQAERARQVSEFLAGMFADADPMRSHGIDLSAVDILDISQQSIAREFADDPAVRAQLRTAIGAAYSGLNRLPQARAVLQEAEADLSESETKATASADLEMARSNREIRLEWLIAAASLERRDGNYEKGKSFLDRALAELPGDQDSLRQAQEYYEFGDVQAAMEEREQYSLLRARLLYDYGELYSANGESGLALEYFELSLNIRERWLPTTDGAVIGTMARVAGEKANREDVEGASQDFDRLMALIDGRREKDLPQFQALSGYVDFLLRQQRYSEAVGFAREAFQIAESLLPQGHPATISAATYLARILNLVGDEDEAASLFRRFYANVNEDSTGLSSSAIGSLQLADVLHARGELDQALALYQQNFNQALQGLDTSAWEVDYFRRQYEALREAVGGTSPPIM